METPKMPSSKVVDLLLENLKDTLNIIDRAFLLAILAAAFVVVHGLQGDMERDVREKLERTAKAKSPASQIQEAKDTQDHQIDVPVLGFKADLSTAIVIGSVCYWIFSIRAALHVRRIRPIIVRLSTLDAEILGAALVRPSLATAGPISQLLSCLALGGFGWASFLLSQLPYSAVIGRSVSATVVEGVILMFIPAVILFVATVGTSSLIKSVTRPNQAMQRTAPGSAKT
jgi:hypothetical protein